MKPHRVVWGAFLEIQIPEPVSDLPNQNCWEWDPEYTFLACVPDDSYTTCTAPNHGAI